VMAHRHPEDVNKDRTGVLITRPWLEEGSAAPLRAHIRLTTDMCSGFDRSITLTSAHAVFRTVEIWLRDMLTGRPHR
jgi:hypothetical protein